jgi:arsenical pump membrane protein
VSLAIPHALAAAAILAAVLALVVLRPRGLHVAWPAGVGALLVLAAGLLAAPALLTIFADTWDAAATLIALFILSETLDSNGFFTWAALHLARTARGSGWRLFALVLMLTTGVTALLANDGAVLMLTPIFATLLLRIYPDEHSRLPYIFAAGFFADAMSAILVPSNLTNIIVADAYHLTFAHVAAWMALPAIAAFGAGALAFAGRFRVQLGKPFDPATLGRPADAIHDRIVFWGGWAALGGLIAGYLIGGERHLPFSLIAGSAALAMLALVRLRGLRSVGAVLRGAPWGILVYALGMFVVITAAFDAHTLTFLTRPLAADAGTGPRGVLVAGGLLGLLAAAVNNLPATLIGVLALRGAAHPASLTLYAMMLGVDIGPKLTPFGSLATLLWLGILDRNGIHISWGHYLRENWWIALLVLAAALAGLVAARLALG